MEDEKSEHIQRPGLSETQNRLLDSYTNNINNAGRDIVFLKFL